MLRRFVFLFSLAASLAACQAPPETSARPTRPAAATAVPPDSTATPPPLPDSLALTPVAPLPDLPDTLRQAIRALHAALGPAAADLRPAVFEQACVGYLSLRPGSPRRSGPLAVADLDLPNTAERLWVIDLPSAQVLHHSRVAHGRGSGHLRAVRFSNVRKSACSALGFYRTGESYDGRHGYSRYLHGLDPGQNSAAFSRYIVLHSATYVSPAFVATHGHLGYSRGCPALPPAQAGAIIRALPAGSTLLLSGPGLRSQWLDGAAAARRFAARGWR